MSDISEVEVKVAVAKQKKEQGDAAFSQDDVPGGKGVLGPFSLAERDTNETTSAQSIS